MRTEWNAGILRAAFAAFETAADLGAGTLFQMAKEQLAADFGQSQVNHRMAKHAAVSRLIHQIEAQVPSTSNIDKICRYETHLEKGIYRAIAELRSLQTARTQNPQGIATLG